MHDPSRAYPGSFDYHNRRCFECCEQPMLCVPDHCFTGTDDCLKLDLARLTPVIEDVFREFPSFLNHGDAKACVASISTNGETLSSNGCAC